MATEYDPEFRRQHQLRQQRSRRPPDDRFLLIEHWFTRQGIDVFTDPADLAGVVTGVLKNAPYTTVYGRQKASHFLLQHQGQHYRINYHAQHSSGTVEEKLPFWMDNALAVPERVILILDGDGFSDGAKAYALREGDASGGKVRVFCDVSAALTFLGTLLGKKELSA